MEITDKAFVEAKNRFKCDDGGYDLIPIVAFIVGAEIVEKLISERRSPIVDINAMIEGYRWAVEELGENY